MPKLVTRRSRRFGAVTPMRAVGMGIGYGAVTGYKAYMRGAGSQTRVKREREFSNRTNTTQRDVTTRYVRRRMPPYKRRRWVSFVKKTRAVELAQQPLQVYQALLKSSKTVTLGEQWTEGVLLKDNNMPNQADLVNMFKDAYGGGGLPTDYDSRRLYLKSCTLDLQIKNIGTEQCIIDVYHIKARKSYQSSAGGTSNSLNDIWNDCFGDSTAVGAVSAANAALTPFDVPSFCKYFLVKSKREYIISPDQVVTMQLRDPRNLMLQGRLLNLGRFGTLAEGYLMQIRGVPEDTLAASGLTSAVVAWSAQTTYHYAVPPGYTTESIGQSK